MPRTKQRKRNRRKRQENDLRQALRLAQQIDAKACQSKHLTPGNGALWRLLCNLERSSGTVWSVAKAIHCTDDEMEMLRAMIAQVVAPHLAGMTPGNVRSRLKEADAMART